MRYSHIIEYLFLTKNDTSNLKHKNIVKQQFDIYTNISPVYDEITKHFYYDLGKMNLYKNYLI